MHPLFILRLRQEACGTCQGSGLQACYNCDGQGSYETYGVVVVCKVFFDRFVHSVGEAVTQQFKQGESEVTVVVVCANGHRRCCTSLAFGYRETGSRGLGPVAKHLYAHAATAFVSPHIDVSKSCCVSSIETSTVRKRDDTYATHYGKMFIVTTKRTQEQTTSQQFL